MDLKLQKPIAYETEQQTIQMAMADRRAHAAPFCTREHGVIRSKNNLVFLFNDNLDNLAIRMVLNE